jgi:hypothetical protein
VGIMDLSVTGSDAASDFNYTLGKAILKILKEEAVKDSGNRLNTDGFTNVCLVVEELVIPGNHFISDDEWVKFVAKLVFYIKKVIVQLKKSKDEDSEDSENLKHYLDRFREMQTSFEKYVKEARH